LLNYAFPKVRVVALGLRAAWAADLSAHGIEHFSIPLYIAASVSFAAGFFIVLAQLLLLLQAWYSSVGKTDVPMPLLGSESEWRVAGLLRILSVGVTVFSILGVIGGVQYGEASAGSQQQQQLDNADVLRSASAWGFVAVDAVILACTLFFTANAHMSGKLAVVAPLLKTVLPAAAVLLIRVVYSAVMVDLALNDPQNPIASDQGFYPLSILPEIVAVAILCAPSAVHNIVYGQGGKEEQGQAMA